MIDPPRRAVLGGLAATAIAGAAQAQNADIPVIDTHVHLFDPRRPQGVPYSGPRGQPPQMALPENYRQQIVRTGIVGAVVVEASPWIEDNLWILERADSDPIFVGVVGSLDPSKPEFGEYLNVSPRIRCGAASAMPASGRWRAASRCSSPAWRTGLKLLAQAGQTLDMANPPSTCCAGRCWRWTRRPICAW